MIAVLLLALSFQGLARADIHSGIPATLQLLQGAMSTRGVYGLLTKNGRGLPSWARKTCLPCPSVSGIRIADRLSARGWTRLKARPRSPAFIKLAIV